jgi:hypothetical protein
MAIVFQKHCEKSGNFLFPNIKGINDWIFPLFSFFLVFFPGHQDAKISHKK